MADQNIPVTSDTDVIIDCDNDGGSSSQKIIFSHDNGTELMRVQENGNVGIGDTAPANLLSVKGSRDNEYIARMENAYSGANSYGLLVKTNGSTSNTVTAVEVYSDSNSIFQVSNNGNIGVGTSNPNARLDVRGSVIINDAGADNDVRIEGDTDVNLFFTDASADKVGVGTSAPSAKLHVKSDGTSTDQLRLENSGTNGKVWQIGDGPATAGVLSIRDQTAGIVVANFNFKQISSENCRCLQIGDVSGAQQRFDVLVIGQEGGTYSGATRAGNNIIIRLDNGSTNTPFAQYAPGFRNQADTSNFQAGYITFRKVADVNKGTLALATYNGTSLTEAIFIDQDQKVGLGTSAPVNRLDIAGSVALGAYYGTAAPTNGLIVSGKVGLGNTSPANAIDINGAVAIGGYAGTTAPNSGLIVSGDVGIGTSSPSYLLQLGADSAAKPASSSWTIPSDKRLKKDIEPFFDGLKTVMAINPIRYRLNGKAGLPKGMEGIGILADEMLPIAPYTIGKWKAKLEPTDNADTELLDFNAGALTFVLVNAIKELRQMVDRLESRIGELQRESPDPSALAALER